MDLRAAIEEYQHQFEGGVDERERDTRAASLDLLQEFLADDASIETLEVLSVADLEEFFVEWYLRQPGAAAAVAVPLLDAVRGWLEWCKSRHGLALGAEFEPLYVRLRVDLRRIL